MIIYAYLDTSLPPLVACTECIEVSDPAPVLDTSLKRASALSVSGRVVSRQAEEKIFGKHNTKECFLDKNELCKNAKQQRHSEHDKNGIFVQADKDESAAVNGFKKGKFSPAAPCPFGITLPAG